MPITLYSDGNHQCLMFHDLVKGDGVQSNQFLIDDGKDCAVIDPGGQLTFTPLTFAVSRFIDIKDLKYLLISHQDPDIGASLPDWISRTSADIVASRLWSRFLPHFVPGYLEKNISNHMISVPDRGMNLEFGEQGIKVVPAHFLHSVGNLQFYDVKSKILFSGDMGASMSKIDDEMVVTDFDQHLSSMDGFHRRYMGSKKVCRLWANMVRQMDVSMIVPQHGKMFKGPEMIERFLSWIENLDCGIDLLSEDDYRCP